MVVSKIIGLLLIFFIITLASVLAIQTYSATDNRANVTAEYQGAYDTARTASAVNIQFLTPFAYILMAFLVIIAIYGAFKMFM
jgi:ABC-type sulfate transport system permease component